MNDAALWSPEQEAEERATVEPELTPEQEAGEEAEYRRTMAAQARHKARMEQAQAGQMFADELPEAREYKAPRVAATACQGGFSKRTANGKSETMLDALAWVQSAADRTGD